MRRQFRRREVAVAHNECETLPGSVLGDLAVTDYTPNVWTITHVPSGLALSTSSGTWGVLDKRNAHEIVRTLVDGPIDWSASGAELADHERARDAVDAAWFAAEGRL
jgi:hypothetical protein